MKPSTMENKLRKLGVLVFWLLMWQIIYWIVGKDVLVPSLFDTLKTLWDMLGQSQFYLQIGSTFMRVVMGVGISLVLGLALASLSYWEDFIEILLRPMVALMKSTPIMAIIILAILWFKPNDVPVFVCVLMCYPIVYTNLLTGLKALDQELIEMSKIYCVKTWLVVQKCYWPQLKKYMLASLELSLGMAWKVVIAAEVLSLPQYAIGDALLKAKLYIETTKVFAWIIVIVVLSLGCEALIHFLFKKGVKHD